MKKFVITYWTQQNDEAVEKQKIINSPSILEALKEFVRKHPFRNISIVEDITPLLNITNLLIKKNTNENI